MGNFPTFLSDSAMMVLKEGSHAAGADIFSGRIGCDEVVLEFGNGIKIQAALDNPVCPPVSVSGTSIFSQA